MSIEITRFTADDREQWNEYVDRSPAGTAFHRFEFLELLDAHAGAAGYYPLVGYKGQEPVGLFPAFAIRKGGVSTVFSPPPRLGIPFMGPIALDHGALSQRKAERRTRRFVEGCLEWLTEAVAPRYWNVTAPTGFEDPRPFAWNGFDATPKHTYLVDIDRDEEIIKRSFSKSLRRSLDTDADGRVRIEAGDEDDVRYVHEQIADRYAAQDRTYPVPLDFLLEAYRTLPDEAMQPYVGFVDGERASGIVTYRDDETVYYSEGGGRPDVEFPINDVLHWHIIREARSAGCRFYDLCGANTPRLCTYKSKFNPELATYYTFEDGSSIMTAASSLYKRLR